MKISEWRLEYTITLLIFFAVILFVIPTSLQSTFQANLISKWKDCYKRLEYMQDVILKQEQAKILTSFKRAKTPEEREFLIIKLIKPYFRLNDTKVPAKYKVKFMDNEKILVNDFYYISDYFFTDNQMIVGIKDFPDNNKTETMFIMTFDINGLLPPNTWGKDVFGTKIYPDRIEAFGKDLDIQIINEDCSKNGSGTSCSFYYLIGGTPND